MSVKLKFTETGEILIPHTIIDDGQGADAFGRRRVAEPHTIFDSKQIFDNAPLFWDEKLESGASISSSYSSNQAATTITSTLNTAGKFTRQTFMRFNYQPGKSQFILMTGVLIASGGGTGVKSRIGIFDDRNGIFFEYNAGTVYAAIRSYVTGSAVNNPIAQSSWNIDKMDGTGISGININWTKTQIFAFDYEWLGVGKVRIGLVVDGILYPIHEFNHANSLSVVYMSTPNLPLRYQLETTASSPASSMVAICSSVMSEGGMQENGLLFSTNMGSTSINANTVGTAYALKGIRLKSTHFGATISIIDIGAIGLTASDNILLELRFNPTVAGTFEYSALTNSAIEIATGDTTGNPCTNTVTDGEIIFSGYVSQQSSAVFNTPNARRLGVDLDGVADTLVLCVTPLGSNLDAAGYLSWRELS